MNKWLAVVAREREREREREGEGDEEAGERRLALCECV
jgi:hypothetical protein